MASNQQQQSSPIDGNATTTAMVTRDLRIGMVAGSVLIVAGATAVAWWRGADPVEVVAIALFVLPMIGVAFGRMLGGIAGAGLASAAYLGLRLSTLGGLDPSLFVGSMTTRVVMYFLFGMVGAALAGAMNEQFRLLQVTSRTDFDTGADNVNAALETVQREMARAQRYGTEFSVIAVHVGPDIVSALGRAPTQTILSAMSTTYRRSVRATDHVARVRNDGGGEDLYLILPETGVIGAHTLLERAVERGRAAAAGVQPSIPLQEIDGEAWTVPGAESEIAQLREAWARQTATA